MNDELYEQALKAIQVLFDDASVSQEKAKENMDGLRDEIEILVDSLDIS